MGRMKELCIDICNANNGELPPDLSMADAVLMRQWNIYNWEEYEKKKNEDNYYKGEKYKEKKFDWDTDKREAQAEEDPF